MTRSVIPRAKGLPLGNARDPGKFNIKLTTGFPLGGGNDRQKSPLFRTDFLKILLSLYLYRRTHCCINSQVFDISSFSGIWFHFFESIQKCFKIFF